MGGAAHEWKWWRLKIQQRYGGTENFFSLPHEVFELGLKRDELLVYLYLVYHNSLKYASKLSCAIISEAVGLCEKTVRTHLQTLTDEGFIQLRNNDGQLSCTLCPIWDKVSTHHSAALFSTSEGGESG